MRAQHLHKWSVTGFHKMAEAGLFDPEARMELIDGEIFDMTPMGNMHRGLVIELTSRFIDAFRGKALVSPQCPVILGMDDEPEPDFAILRPDDYKRKAPTAEAILLLVEISDSTLDFDQNTKLPMYARHGIPETWIINVPEQLLEIYADPEKGIYRSEQKITAPVGKVKFEQLGVQIDCTGLFER